MLKKVMRLVGTWVAWLILGLELRAPRLVSINFSGLQNAYPCNKQNMPHSVSSWTDKLLALDRECSSDRSISFGHSALCMEAIIEERYGNWRDTKRVF